MDLTNIGQDVPLGSPMDPMDHPADSGHNAVHAKGRAVTADSPTNDQDEAFRKNATNQSIKPGKSRPGY